MPNRNEFLDNPDVSGFINWLGEDLVRREFKLIFSPSRFVPGGLNVMTAGIESVLAHYRWQSSWVDSRNNQQITSCDWNSTKASLATLSQWLNNSIDDKDERKTYEATIAVLNWGGVSGASGLLHRLYENGQLVQYLKKTRDILSVNGDNRVEDITSKNIFKFDSGLTKIHALHANDGSPIYDTRVAAAVSLLYRLYRRGLENEPILVT